MAPRRDRFGHVRRRNWVCAHCETGGADHPPLRCAWCDRPAIDGGSAIRVVNGAYITRVIDEQGGRQLIDD